MIFPKNILLEDTNMVKQPIFKLDEIADVYEVAMKELDTQIKIPKDVLNSFQIKDKLDQDIWDNKTLKLEIKKKLLKVAVDFFKELELPEEMKLKDVLFVGSLANYNWSKYSDIDLHLLVDFSKFKEDAEFIKKFFDAQKNLFNLQHDMKIAGYPVELYVQDVKEKLHSGSVYSVPYDKWILSPDKKNFKLDRIILKKKVEKIFDKLKIIKSKYEDKDYQKVIDDIDKLKNKIKQMRKAGLEKVGEYSTENLVFKVLRRTDFMEILDTYKNKAYDYLVSIKEEQP